MLAALMLNLRLIILMNYIGQLRVEIFIVSIINMKIKTRTEIKPEATRFFEQSECKSIF